MDSSIFDPGAQPANWETNGGFLLYFLSACYIFCAFEIICDEFFVPALNLFCTRLGMPDDFAGATLMGLGACAPDVFSGLFGLLVLKTDVGVGTIVGSLLFNHLAIIGGVCLVVGSFKVKFASFFREVLFYALALLLFFVSLRDSKVSTAESCMFIGLYVVFVLVCAFTPRLQKLFEWIYAKMAPLFKKGSTSVEEDALVEERGRKPTVTNPFDDDYDPSEWEAANDPFEEPAQKLAAPTEENVARLKGACAQSFASIMETKLHALPTGASIGLGYGPVHNHGYLSKRSDWYSKSKVNSHQWQNRWYVLDSAFWFCPNPLFPTEQRSEIPLWAAYKVESDPEDPCAFTLYTSVKNYAFRADNFQHATEWVDCLSQRIGMTRQFCPDLVLGPGVAFHDEDEADAMWARPMEGFFKKLFWYLTLPLKLLFSLTIPNVKKFKWQRWYPLTFLCVLLWLGVLSFAMIWCADRFAFVLGIPEDIMGLTITAIGASMPSFFSSVISAKQGSYNMAISNTFGANLSSILVAVGLPCFIQSVFITPGVPVVMDSSGIKTTVTVLAIALLAFVISISITKLTFNRTLGFLYLGMYVFLLLLVVLIEKLGYSW